MPVSRRYLLAAILAIIAACLLFGGVKLILLGGSAYYLLAGATVGGAAYLSARGDSRGRWLYGLMLIGTLIWAAIETGLNPWGMQARLFAPLVLGIWVFWPDIRRIPALWLLGAASVLAGAFALFLYNANRTEDGDPFSAADLPGARTDWPFYGGDLAGSRFSPLTQINMSNVRDLKQAWVQNLGMEHPGMAFETTPLMVDDTLYACSPGTVITAMDADTGAVKWKFNPNLKPTGVAVCRGVSFFAVPDATGFCARRIIFGTNDARLMQVDSATGKPCPGFGQNGAVNLKEGMGDVPRGYYFLSSPPAIVNGNIVLGGWITDNQYVGEPSGVVRAFDAITGKLVWAFDMERPDERGLPPAGQEYTRGTANSWAPMSGDEKLGLVFVPTGNATPDYWGGHRKPGSEKFAASVIALDSRTGQVRWSFQTSHHDLWDYDVASQPTLIDLPIKGRTVAALIQPTKRGEVFVLDRATGQPLFPVVEKPVPQGAAQGDFTSPTQPFSTEMPSFATAEISERTMWGATPLDQLWCRIAFKGARYEGTMTPADVRPAIGYPGFLGGIDWGSVAIDPVNKLMVVNWSIIANYTRLVPRSEAAHVKLVPEGATHEGEPTPMLGTPFALLNGAFLSPIGMPCNQPPFGMIGTVDLKTGKLIWQRSLGSSRDSGPLATPTLLPLPMGVPNMGGSIVTRSGLVFIGATTERALRAYDLRSGKMVWYGRLPAAGNATPMTYRSSRTGKQYVVIAAGGSTPMQSKRGDAIVAYSLP